MFGQKYIYSKTINDTDYYISKWLRRDYKQHMTSIDIQKLIRDAHYPHILNDPRIKFIPEIYTRIMDPFYTSSIMTPEQHTFFKRIFQVPNPEVLTFLVMTFIDTQFDTIQTIELMNRYKYFTDSDDIKMTIASINKALL